MILTLLLALNLALAPTTVYLPVAANSCFASAEASTFYNLLVMSPEQKRPEMKCNQALSIAAQRHAEQLARQQAVTHCDDRGLCPNGYAWMAGCAHTYTFEGNNVESIVAGLDTPEKAVAHLLESPSHRRHLLGLSEFFAAQEYIGVGFAWVPGSVYQYYYVFMSSEVC